MKRSIIYLALGFIALGCTNLELVDNNSLRVQFPDEYLAYTDAETQTRVFVNTSLKTLWNADDRITIFNDTYNAQWKFKGETGADNGTFSKVDDEYYTAADIPTTYAVYPYNPSTSITEKGEITLTLPAVQHYAQNSYGLGANTMVAATKTPTSNALYFKSLCSFVVIQLYGTGSVKSITLTGNNGEKLAGTATVTPVYGEAPVATMSDAATTSITLDCGDGVTLGSTAATATEFWFCIPPTTFSKGFTIKATNTDGYYMEKVTSSKKVFERNTKYTMAAIEGVFDQLETPEYVPFEDANFKAYCVENFDTDGDGEISMEEAERVKRITVDGGVMKSLKGIEYFTKLWDLNCSLKCSRGRTGNDGKMHYYDSNGNEVFGLTSLDVSQNTALIDLICRDNQITSLDVSKNTALGSLDCSGNQLTSLDLSKNTALTDLDCGSNQLTTLDVSGCTALTDLDCGSNQLTTLDVSGCTALTDLVCYYNQLTSLDVSGCTALTGLYCYSNQLTSLDVSKNTALTILNCDNNQLTSLDVSNNTALTDLVCDNNQLTSLDVSNNTALTDLVCDNNQLTSLDVSNNTALTDLSCRDNQITSLDVSKNTALTDLVCDNNQLTSLDVSNNTALTDLVCDNNQLTSLDVSKNTALTDLWCSENQLTNLDVSKNTALTWLACSGNQLTSLDVSKNTALNYLLCYNNQLTSLDVSKNTALTDLYCYYNQLTSLDVSKNTALTLLVCNNNQISTIYVWEGFDPSNLYIQKDDSASFVVKQ